MAEYYVDHGAYAAQGSIGLNAPTTWGVPQEGDGASKDAATEAATAFVSFSATPTSGTISVCGVSISTTGVLSAGSADAAANALATNINATTTTVAAGVALGVPQLRNLVYARGPSGGAPAGTCQIMSRVGSAKTNYSDNTNWLIAHTLNNSTETAGNRQFAGGSGGCWGWVINPSAIGASSSIAAGAYGLIGTSKPMLTATNADLAITDPVHSRNNKTIDLSSNTGVSMTGLPNLNFLVDDGTVWSGDSTSGVLSVTFASAGADVPLHIGASASSPTRKIGARRRGKLRFHFRSSSGGGFMTVKSEASSGNPSVLLFNTEISEAITIPAAVGIRFANANVTYLHLEDCDILYPVARSTWYTGQLIGGTILGLIQLVGCSIVANHNSVTDPGPLFQGSFVAGGNRNLVRFSGCRVSGWSSGDYKVFGTITSPENGAFIAENCQGVRLDASSYVGLFGASDGARGDEFIRQHIHNSLDIGGAFRHENLRGVSEWIPGANFPTLGAVTPGGVAWSMRMLWAGTAGRIAPATPYEGLPFEQFFREADAVKTLTLELLIPNAITPTEQHMQLSVTYIDEFGNIQREKGAIGTATLATSTAAWTLNGLSGYSKYKIALTTAQKIKQNTRVSARLSLLLPSPSGSNTEIYVNPEPALT